MRLYNCADRVINLDLLIDAAWTTNVKERILVLDFAGPPCGYDTYSISFFGPAAEALWVYLCRIAETEQTEIKGTTQDELYRLIRIAQRVCDECICEKRGCIMCGEARDVINVMVSKLGSRRMSGSRPESGGDSRKA